MDRSWLPFISAWRRHALTSPSETLGTGFCHSSMHSFTARPKELTTIPSLNFVFLNRFRIAIALTISIDEQIYTPKRIRMYIPKKGSRMKSNNSALSPQTYISPETRNQLKGQNDK